MITKERVIEIINELPRDKMNPMSGARCMYTDREDENWHCFAGEIAARAGTPMPSPGAPVVKESIEFTDYYAPDALEVLDIGQNLADRGEAKWNPVTKTAGRGAPGEIRIEIAAVPQPQPWGVVIDAMRENGVI